MSTKRATESSEGSLNERLKTLLGAQHVLEDADTIDFYSSDIFDQKELADLVVRPGSVEETAEAIGLCTAAGYAVLPRGGGMSYTGGYLPIRKHSAIFDLQRLDKIVEINREDMYVTVEAGVTWHQLREALAPLKLRTPYWGTVSGYHATIGGSLSQGSTHFGSTEWGPSGDSCLAVEVALADGTRVRTGSSSAIEQPSPFFRGYGPDLTGLFLNDTGALGMKLRVTLRLIEAPSEQRYLTAAFSDVAQLFGAMSDVSRARLAAECGGWDPALVNRFGSADNALGEDLKYLANVVRSGKSMFAGLRDALGIAVAGRRAWQGDVFLIHVTIDDRGKAAADEKLAEVKAIVSKHGGRLIPASYPRAHRALPFSDLTQVRRVEERTLPTHGICPHSRAVAVAREVYEIFAHNADLLGCHGVTWSLISSAVGNNAILVEPLIYYPDHRGAHYARIPAKPGDRPASVGAADPAVIHAIWKVRRELAVMFLRHGCAHLQIGKSYPYREGRAPETWALLEAIKAAVDPQGLMNPGSLGLVGGPALLNSPFNEPVKSSP